MPKSALITGCSSGGIGYTLVKTLQKRGLIVFATARNPSKMSGLEKLEGVHLLSLDVTNPASIAAAVKVVEAKTKKLDYLFNNSGQSYIIPVVDVDIEEAKKIFDVNFWGVLRTVQSFIPLLMEAKGTIVTIGAGSGLVHLPYMGIYNASKAAVHMLDETLRIELAPFAVNVLTVVVGAIETGFQENNRSVDLPQGSKYHAVKDKIDAIARWETGDRRTKVADFATMLADDVLGGKVGMTYRGSQASVARYASALMPISLMDRILVKNTGLDTLHPANKS